MATAPPANEKAPLALDAMGLNGVKDVTFHYGREAGVIDHFAVGIECFEQHGCPGGAPKRDRH
jgi:hypothetical protein